MSDIDNIFHLYLENATNQEPQMHVDKKGTQTWWLGDTLHRKDGPAIISPDGSELWLQHNKLHREDGKAVNMAPQFRGVSIRNPKNELVGAFVVDDFEGNVWWLNDRPYATAEAWAVAILKMHNKPATAEDAQRLLRVVLMKDDLL
jgi:hypothetical protein